MSGRDRIAIESERFGRLEIEESRLLHFEGLPGFPDARRFALLEHDRSSPFAWLVCVEEPELAFVVTPPYLFFPDYDPPVADAVLERIGGKAGDELEVLGIASVQPGGEIHLNLAAPLVVHPETRRGVQAILDGGDFSARQPLPEFAAEPTGEDAASAPPTPTPPGSAERPR